MPVHISSEQLVKDSKADVGLAVDPDVDRLALVDDKGRAIGEDYTLALAARVVLRRRRGPIDGRASSVPMSPSSTAGSRKRGRRSPMSRVGSSTARLPNPRR